MEYKTYEYFIENYLNKRILCETAKEVKFLHSLYRPFNLRIWDPCYRDNLIIYYNKDYNSYIHDINREYNITYDDLMKDLLVKDINIQELIDEINNNYITTKTTKQMEEKLELKLSEILNHFKNGVERYEIDDQGVGSIQSIYSLTDEECDELFKNPLIKGRRVKKLEKQTTNI